MELELFVNVMIGGIVLLMVLLAWWGLTAAGDKAKAKAKADGQGISGKNGRYEQR